MLPDAEAAGNTATAPANAAPSSLTSNSSAPPGPVPAERMRTKYLLDAVLPEANARSLVKGCEASVAAPLLPTWITHVVLGRNGPKAVKNRNTTPC